MFTGIIQTIGKIHMIEEKGGDLRIVVSNSDFNDEVIELGDSIACNGVCLTVVDILQNSNERLYSFDVSKESISRSLIGQWKVGQGINMELAMLPTTRFGGHIVSGHVDGLGEIFSMEEDARSWRIGVNAQEDLAKFIAAKGSITVDGISLTVNKVHKEAFFVNIVPHTFQVTTLGNRKVGDKVHLEIDVLARYLDRLLNYDHKESSELSIEKLTEYGFIKPSH